jgi:hypothetical protein
MMDMAVNCLVKEARRKSVFDVDFPKRAQIGNAVAALEHSSAIFVHQDGEPGGFSIRERGEDGIDAGFDRVLRYAWCARGKSRQQKHLHCPHDSDKYNCRSGRLTC